jgi:hypothetical protein
MACPLKPVVLSFPDHSSGVSRQDQVGCQEAVYQYRLLAAAAAFASSTVGLPSSVDASISGVNFVIIPGITGCEVSDIPPRLPGLCSVACTRMPRRWLLAEKGPQAPDYLMPRLFKLLFEAPYQFVELL